MAIRVAYLLAPTKETPRKLITPVLLTQEYLTLAGRIGVGLGVLNIPSLTVIASSRQPESELSLINPIADRHMSESDFYGRYGVYRIAYQPWTHGS
jgi:hypothetical protein